MTEFTYAIKDPNGIHARPAGMLVKECAKYNCSITIDGNGKTADAKKIFAVMGLGAVSYTHLDVYKRQILNRY